MVVVVVCSESNCMTRRSASDDDSFDHDEETSRKKTDDAVGREHQKRGGLGDDTLGVRVFWVKYSLLQFQKKTFARSFRLRSVFVGCFPTVFAPNGIFPTSN